MKATISILLCLVFLYLFVVEVDASGKVHQAQYQHNYNKQQQHYYNKHAQQQHQYNKRIQSQRYGYNKNYQTYNNNYYYKYKYKKRKYVKWPKIRGRCSHSTWQIDGDNPVMLEAKKGNLVVLYLLKTSEDYSYQQLVRLNDFAEHNQGMGLPITVMALNSRSRKLPPSYRTRFSYIKFYQEQENQNIFSQIRGNYRQIIIYDVCGRQQYHFDYPYSWMGFPWVKQAVDNTHRFHESHMLCGRCVAKKTTSPSSSAAGNFTTVTTTKRIKPTDKAVDGPYTNIPITPTKQKFRSLK